MAVRSYNGRETLDGFNRTFESSPGGVPTVISGRWLNGTSGGSPTDNTYRWGVNNVNSIGGYLGFIDSSTSFSGLNSLKVSTTSTSSVACVAMNITNAISVLDAGCVLTGGLRTFRYSYRMKTNYVSGDSLDGAFMQFTERNSNGTALISTFGTKVKTTTDWTLYSGTFTTRVNTKYISVIAFVIGNTGAGTLIMDAWFDDISLTEVLPARTTISTPRTLAPNRVLTRDMGTALSFDGVSNVVVSNAAMPSTIMDACSFTCAFKCNTPVSASRQTIAQWGFGASKRFVVQINTDGRVTAAYYDGATYTSSTTNRAITGNVWYGLGASFDGTTPTLYLYNGVNAFSLSTSTFAQSDTTSLYRIGSRGASSQPFGGIIDEPRLWTRPISAPEYINLYFNNIVPNNPYIVWLFNDIIDTTALDSSGNENNGTITGATYITDTPKRLRTAV